MSCCRRRCTWMPSLTWIGRRGQVELLTAPWVWPAGARTRRAVSSFGISGTNAHVIEAVPVAPRREAGWRGAGGAVGGVGEVGVGVAGQAARLAAYV